MNLLKFFVRKPNDWVIVAKLRCGYMFLSKADDKLGTVPYAWEAWLYENSQGKRKVKECGNAPMHRTTRMTLTRWKQHKMDIPIIPNWTHITKGGQPYILDTTP
jgi:hypothetical protein